MKVIKLVQIHYKYIDCNDSIGMSVSKYIRLNIVHPYLCNKL